MSSTLIVYESKYGFTERIAKMLALILGPARYAKASNFDGNKDHYETIVICTPIYSEKVDENITLFVSEHKDWLKQKKVVLICSCLAENKGNEYLKPLQDIIGESVLFKKTIGGELIIDKLTDSDYCSMKHFSDITGFKLEDSITFDQNKFIELALLIKENKDEGKKILVEKLRKQYMDEFIKSHNTCTLATGHGSNVRATPIEYTYYNDNIYLLSEGGEKYANLLINPNVSIGIYDAYKSMSELSGMQIMGVAEMIEIGSDEYINVLKQNNLQLDNIISLPVSLNLIKINIKKIEFLWSDFAKLKVDLKQILYK